MEKKPDNQIIVIFGASGDLTTRKLIPALFELFCEKLLPEGFAVLGVSRTELDDASFRSRLEESLSKSRAIRDSCRDVIQEFLKTVYYLSMETSEEGEYVKLREKMMDLDFRYNSHGNHLYYLATPPAMYELIPAFLASQGLNRTGSEQQNRRIIIEKPFGTSLASARQLNRSLLQHFHENQIYRIDHYLGKETVQNLLVTRFSNGIFEPLWNRNFIEYIEITAAESLGIETRGGYYDHSGALRDMVQNHLLQLTGLVAMEPPALIESTSIRNETAKVFQSIRPYTPAELEKNVIRGQYTGSTIRGESFPGYREEKGVQAGSRTETFVAMKFYIENWRWAGVPFYIRTGKRLPSRVTEIVIHFRHAPLVLFRNDSHLQPVNNQLIIRIQPDEGILFKFGMKVPGAGFNVQEVGMDFHYKDLSNLRVPEAYERLLLDCMHGDSTLYTRSDALEAAWQFVDPVLEYWQNSPESKVYGYPAGTWGPEAAELLFGASGNGWRHPCKNLADDGLYCEL
ncbi:MAG: glucose-6-phosphate dehydrogenase [Bacteroidales bacterium]